MPPLPIIPDTFRCALHWISAIGQDAVNVMHIRNVGGDAAAVFADLNANVTHDMWVSVHSTCSVDVVTITPLDGSTASSDFPTGTPAKWSGSGGLDFIPSTAAIVKFTTALRGRSFRGRAFLPFTSEESNVNGSLIPAAQGPMQTDWTAFLAAMNAAGSQPVIASYKHAVAHTIQFALVETELAVQRRRQERNR